VGLRELYEHYHDRVQFLSIYIREAHPVDGWWLGKGPLARLMKLVGMKARTDVHDPTSIEERREVAGSCEQSLEYGIPTLVDEMDDAVNRAYAAWPTRLYLVGTDGRIAYAGGLGPWGFKPTELGWAIEAYLSEATPAAP
jgi:hypothetical protein